MELDELGRWIDRPLEEVLAMPIVTGEEIPPPVPEAWWELFEHSNGADDQPADPELPPPPVPAPNPPLAAAMPADTAAGTAGRFRAP
jgi:hypothetical protein